MTGVTTPRVSKKEAVASSRKSAKTFDRWLEQGRFDSPDPTEKNADGEWRISTRSLLASGFWENSTGPNWDPPASPSAPASDEEAGQEKLAEAERRRADELEQQVEVLNERVAGFQRAAEEAAKTQRALETAERNSEQLLKTLQDDLERERANTERERSNAAAERARADAAEARERARAESRSLLQKIFGRKPDPLPVPVAELPPVPPDPVEDDPVEDDPIEVEPTDPADSE